MAEVKQAYRRLVKANHPDRAGETALPRFLAIQAAYAEGLTEIDFLGDAEPWKLEWTSTSRGHDWLYVFSGTIRAQLLHSVKFQWLPELKKWRA